MRAHPVFTLALALAGCGGSSPAARTPATEPVAPAAAATSEAPPPGAACDALRASLEEAEAAALRARAEEEAADTGEDPEAVLAALEEERAEQADPEPPTWRCPAPDPGHYLRQAALGPQALPDGARVTLLVGEWMSSRGESMRHVALAFRAPSDRLDVAPIGASYDMGHGQEWEQLRVTEMGVEGGDVTATAQELECVPAGFDEETIDEPPACRVMRWIRLRCSRGPDAVDCGRLEEEPDEETFAE